MNLRAALLAASTALFVPVYAHAVGGVVISQVYGGGGNTGATYTNDFIELYNTGSSAVDLVGWSVQYGSSSSTITQVASVSGTIAANGYYLIQASAGGGGIVSLPTPDAVTSIALSSTSGKVALVTTTTALNCGTPSTPCTGPALASIVDLVGYGTADYFEGSGPAPAPSNTTSVVRGGGGCTDSNDNAADFSVISPNPRNSASSGPLCAVAPVFQSAVSRRVHGAAGTFNLPLSTVVPPAINHNPTTEPRQGPNQTIVFTFDKPLNAVTVTITEGTATVGVPTFTGNDVVVGLTGVTNQQYVTVSLTSVASTDGGTGGTGEVRVGFLLGDVNQTRVVSVADLGIVNSQIAQTVTAGNFLKDVNASGAISVADKGITNANLTKALPTP